MRDRRTRVIVDVALAVALAVALNMLALRLPINVAGGSISLTMLPIAVVALRRGVLAGALAGTLFGCIDLLMEPFILVPAQVLLDYPLPYTLFGAVVGLFAGAYNRAQLRMTKRAHPAAGIAGSERQKTRQENRPAALSPTTIQANTEQGAGEGEKSSPEANTQAAQTGNLALGLAGSSIWVVLAVLLGGAARYFTHVLSGVLFFSEYAGGENVWLYSLVYNVSYIAPSLICSLVGALVLIPVLAQALPVEGFRSVEQR